CVHRYLAFYSYRAPRSLPSSPTRRSSDLHMPSDTSPERLTRYDAYVREAATLYRLPAAYIRAVMQTESNFDPRAVSPAGAIGLIDRKSTRLNSSHVKISYAVFCLKKKNQG